MLSPALLYELGDRCEELRRQVFVADAKPGAARSQAALILAGAYVWAAAALEEFVRSELNLLMDSVTTAAVDVTKVKPSLLAIMLGPEFDGLKQVSGLKMWGRRAGLLERSAASAPATFQRNIHPIDRKTLKAEHFDTIWKVCGLTGPSLPSPRHVLALRELAGFRNDLAHGRVDPVSFGRGKTTSDTIRAIQAVEDIAEHFHVVADSYLTGAGYLR